MKRRIPLVMLCLLLCGCGQQPFPEATDSPLPQAAEDRSLPETAGGEVEKTPLNLPSVQGLRAFGNDLLLFSGEETTVLTLLDGQTLEVLSIASLDVFLDRRDPSLRLHADGRLSFHDPEKNATVLLDKHLQEIRQIPTPGAAVCAPILSEDTRELFYCTASHLRAWDLETGIRRCIKELASEHTLLADVLLEGTVLQCQNGEEILFLSTDDGRILRRVTGDVSLQTRGQQYCGSLRLGHSDLYVFGEGDAAAQMLIPEDTAEKALFLPESGMLLTASLRPDGTRELTLYDLTAGHRITSMALAPNRQILDCVSVGQGICLLIRQEETFVLYRWTPQSAPEDRISRVFPCIPSEELPACQAAAAALEERYRFRILFGESTAAFSSASCAVIPENLEPLLQHGLRLLAEKLALFPPEMLQQTAAHFSEARICLVRDLIQSDPSISEAGCLILEEDTATILIPVGALSGPELYRQLFHLMEIHIFGNSNVFDDWQDLNPAGFRYDYSYEANALRDSGIYLWRDSRAFVDTFSMSYPKEDRASIFAHAMLPGQEELFSSSAMQQKLRAVCTGIRDAYGLSESCPWEQYLQ